MGSLEGKREGLRRRSSFLPYQGMDIPSDEEAGAAHEKRR
jgi:hypothetical protein